MKRILAALIFFTRLPFWRIANIDKKYYEQVVPLWPIVGWLTGGAMAFMAWLTFSIPVLVSVLICLIIRVMITGALHEDGFADFCDGFGGGHGRIHILEIMKDSHIGTYGVLGLILYYFLQVNVLSSLVISLNNPLDIAALFVIGDTFCKWVSSTIIYFLPYARKEEEAKNRLIYQQVPMIEKILSLSIGILPMCIFLPFTAGLTLMPVIAAATMAILTAVFLFHFMYKNILGYTGDCCGATFIITECVFYLILLCAL